MSRVSPQFSLLATVSRAALCSGFAITVAAGAQNEARAQQTQQAPGAPITLPAVSVEERAPANDYKTEESSSQKFTAPLLDTPQTISVIPQSVIREQGARNLTEVLRNTPGISFNAGENGFGISTNNFMLRGFDASGNIFIDGSRDSGSYTRDTFNIEQVEVVKGAAADNGRGGPGGYINMVTKTPDLRNFTRGGVSYGFDEYHSEARKRTTWDVNHAFTDNIAGRLNVLFEDSGVAGRDVAERNSFGFAPSVAIGLGTPTRGILAYEHVEYTDLPDWGVPAATIPGMFRFDPTAGTAPRDAFYGLASDYDDTNSDAVLLRLEHDFSSRMTISNQTRFENVDRNSRFTMPTGYVPGTQQVTTQTSFYDRVNTTITNMTNLSSKFDTGSFHHNVALGLELTREKSDANRYGNVNPGNTGLFNPNKDRALASNLAPTERSEVTVDTIAVYAYDTVQLTQQWEVTGGLRLERYYAEIESQTLAGAPSGALDGFDDSNTTLGGKIGLVYKPLSNGSVYTSFGVSALPPGSYLSNPDISRTGDNAFPGFVEGAKPVESYNYEVGTKWDLFGERLSVSAALFRTEKKNVAITGRDVGETVDSLKGYGKQIVQGIEIGTAGRITDAWSVFGGIALIDSERKHSAYLDEVRKRANPADYGPFDRTSGDELAFTPNVTATLWTTYRLPFGLTVGGGMQYVGSSYLGRPDDANRIIPNGIFGKLPEYVVFNAMASYELTETVDLRLNIDNIADEKYAVSANWPGTRASLGGSRTIMVSLDFDF